MRDQENTVTDIRQSDLVQVRIREQRALASLSAARLIQRAWGVAADTLDPALYGALGDVLAWNGTRVDLERMRARLARVSPQQILAAESPTEAVVVLYNGKLRSNVLTVPAA